MSTSTPAARPKISARGSLSVRLYPVVKKIHAYIGLLNLSIVLVWGVVGMYEMLAPETAGRGHVSESNIPYTAPKDAADRDVANDVYRLVNPPLSGPVPAYALEHDASGNLVLDFYSPNGIVTATVLEQQGRIRVEKRVNNFARYLNNLHTVTPGGEHTSQAMRLWSYYMELSIWSLLAMVLSGLLMWLLSRPLYRPAQFSFAAGLALFVLLYVMVR